MKISHYETITGLDLLRGISCIKLRGHGQPRIYANSPLTITKFHTDELRPAQQYVLKSGVQTILDIYECFKPLGIDVFNLDGGIRFWLEGMDKTEPGIPFLPPLIESSKEPGLGRVWLINDGMHRVYAARKLNRWITGVLASNVPTKYPYYAYALVNGWDSVEELDTLPANYQKKVYREPNDHKALFRDINAVFPGVQKDRPRINGNAA